MKIVALAALAALAAPTAAAFGPNAFSSPMAAAKAYLAFGSSDANPLQHECPQWVALFAANGTSVAPGGPQNDATGAKALLGLCTTIVDGFGVMFGDIAHVQADMSADGKTMLGVAFKWTTVATQAKTGVAIRVPAISYIDFDAAGKFAYTRDFFDPSDLPLGLATHLGRDYSAHLSTAPKALGGDDAPTAAAKAYTMFGALPAAPNKYDCATWAALFTPNGTSAAPGGPQNDATGTKALTGLCQAITSGFGSYFGVINGVNADMSADGKTMLGVAFRWTVAATNAKTGAEIMSPAITYVNFDAAGKMTYSRDFFNPSNLPPGN